MSNEDLLNHDEKKTEQEDWGEIPRVLYKYMSLKSFLGTKYKNDDKPYPGVYLDGNLYFADSSKLNDPMESVSFEKRIPLLVVPPKEDDSNQEPFVDKLHNFYTYLKNYKICSMSSRPDNFAMWSHYADAHKGVCIGFKLKCPEELQNNGIEIARVIYDDFIPVIKNIKSTNGIDWSAKKRLFWHKNESWSYEKEWRLILQSDEPKLIQIGEVIEVLLGYSCGNNPKINRKLDDITKCLESKGKNAHQVLLYQAPEDIGFSLYVPNKHRTSFGRFSNSEWEWEYKSDQKTGITLIRYNCGRSKAKIPEYLYELPVTAIGEPMSSDNADTTNDTGKTSVFAGCNRLTSVIIPARVERIGDLAFAACSKLTKITVAPENKHWKSLKGVLLKGEDVLYAYPMGKRGSYTIPKKIVEISERAFARCTGLTSVTIPAGITKIGKWAFDGCTNLTEVIFEIGSKIPDEAFGCEAFPEETDSHGGDSLKIAYQMEDGGAGTYMREKNSGFLKKQKG